MEKKAVIVFSIFLFIISAKFDAVTSDASDCYDACSTACVYPGNPRLSARCDRKCQIRCSPDVEANEQSKVKQGST